MLHFREARRGRLTELPGFPKRAFALTDGVLHDRTANKITAHNAGWRTQFRFAVSGSCSACVSSNVRPLSMRYLFLSILCLALAGCGLDETNHRSDRPVSRELASKDISVHFHLPRRMFTTFFMLVVCKSGCCLSVLLLIRRIWTVQLTESFPTKTSDETHDSYPSFPSAAGRGPVFPELSPMPWGVQIPSPRLYRGSTNAPPLYLWV